MYMYICIHMYMYIYIFILTADSSFKKLDEDVFEKHLDAPMQHSAVLNEVTSKMIEVVCFQFVNLCTFFILIR